MDLFPSEDDGAPRAEIDPATDPARPTEAWSEFTVPPPSDVQPELRVATHPLPDGALDEDAVRVVHRLERYGFEAYLVGGCIRDLLLGRTPKDFDIVTSARPAEMRHLFRNCRLIGRRFRLAHLHFRDNKIIEVATFRRAPTEEDDVTERHAAENLFGSAADDALRRDFTINALMYDISRRQIRDWVDGLGDVDRRVIRTIGAPARRFAEDPVRIVRAAKFKVLLGLEFDAAMPGAIAECAPLIPRCAPARLVEEILKVLRSGAAARCMSEFMSLGVLPHVLPGFASFCAALEPTARPLSPLAACDEVIRGGRPLSDAVLIAAMLFEGCREALAAEGDIAPVLEERLSALTQPLPFTRRHMASVRQILLAQRRLAGGPLSRRSRRLVTREFASDAVDLLEATADGPQVLAIVASWREALASAGPPADGTSPESPSRRRRRPRRRRAPAAETTENS
jgi:poly(A) polymerase